MSASDVIRFASRSRVDLAASSVPRGPVPLVQPKGELVGILSARYPDARLADMVLPDTIRTRLERVLSEQRHQQHLRGHGLHPRRKLLLVGPPGSGTAAKTRDMKLHRLPWPKDELAALRVSGDGRAVIAMHRTVSASG